MILAACSPGEVQVARIVAGTLQDFALWRPGQPDGVGDTYRARIAARVPAMAGAFVALPDGHGFLPDSEGAASLPEGRVVTVRVTRSAGGGKGPRLSARVPHTEGPPGLLERGPSPLDDLATRFPTEPVHTDDGALVAALRPRLAERVELRRTVFDDALLEQIAALSEPELALPGGMRASVWPTPALVAIDLDMAAATAARSAKQAAQLAANEAALPELARQIRLRNLSGAILVDPAGMSIKRRPLLRPGLEAALAGDPLRPRVLGVTALGLLELVRPRVRPPLHELLARGPAAPYAALRALAAEPEAALAAAPDLHAAISRDGTALSDLRRRTGRPPVLRADPALPPGTFVLKRPR